MIESGSFQTPLASKWDEERYWLSNILDVHNHLSRMIEFETDLPEALRIFNLQMDLVEYVAEFPPDSFIEALVLLLCASKATTGGQELIYRFFTTLTDAQLTMICDTFSIYEKTDGLYWIQTLERDYVLERDYLNANLQDVATAFDLHFPDWMPSWNSFFFQPNRSQQLSLDVRLLSH